MDFKNLIPLILCIIANIKAQDSEGEADATETEPSTTGQKCSATRIKARTSVRDLVWRLNDATTYMKDAGLGSQETRNKTEFSTAIATNAVLFPKEFPGRWDISWNKSRKGYMSYFSINLMAPQITDTLYEINFSVTGDTTVVGNRTACSFASYLSDVYHAPAVSSTLNSSQDIFFSGTQFGEYSSKTMTHRMLVRLNEWTCPITFEALFSIWNSLDLNSPPDTSQASSPMIVNFKIVGRKTIMKPESSINGLAAGQCDNELTYDARLEQQLNSQQSAPADY